MLGSDSVKNIYYNKIMVIFFFVHIDCKVGNLCILKFIKMIILSSKLYTHRHTCVYVCICFEFLFTDLSICGLAHQTKSFGSTPIHIICYFWASRKSNNKKGDIR